MTGYVPERYVSGRPYGVRGFGTGAISIHNANRDAALEALKNYVRRPEMQGRGLYMHLDVLAASTLDEAVAAWTEDAVEFLDDAAGNITGMIVGPMSNPGVLAVLLNALAPYIENGSHLELTDTSRAVWTWHFEGGHARNEFNY